MSRVEKDNLIIEEQNIDEHIINLKKERAHKMLFNNQFKIISEHDLDLIAKDVRDVLQEEFGFNDEMVERFYYKLQNKFERSMYIHRNVIAPINISSLTGSEILNIFAQRKK